MNLKKVIGYSAGIAVLGSALIGCNSGGSQRTGGDQGYGQLVSGGNAESNTTWALQPVPGYTYSESQGYIVSMAGLNIAFATAAVNTYLDPSAITGPQAALKSDNESYVNNTTSIFGLPSNVVIQFPSGVKTGYVAHQANAAGVSTAKLDTITYTTPSAPFLFAGGASSIETVSGLVVLPSDANGKPLAESQIKGVVLYFHPTVLSKAGIPSGYGNSHTQLPNGFASWDDQATFYTQFELASIYASDGYIVIAPDYLGQGIDTSAVHPYVLLPEPNALSGIYMLQALNTYLKQNYSINLANTKKKSLFISSYSEGGGYALKAASLLDDKYASVLANTGLKLKGTVGVSGAYDLTHEELPFAFADVINPGGAYPDTSPNNPWNASPGCEESNPICIGLNQIPGYAQSYRAWAQYDMASAKPPLGTYMVNTLVTYDYTPAAYDLVLRTPYAEQTNCLLPDSLLGESFSFGTCQEANQELSQYPWNSDMQSSYSVMNLFSTVGLDQYNIGDQLFNAAAYNGYFVGGYESTLALITGLYNGESNNSVGSFINTSLITDPYIMSLVAQADTYNLTVQSPVSLIAAKYDSTVTNLDYQSACGNIPSTASSSLAHNSPHVTCVPLVDNTQLFANVNLFGNPVESQPVYMNHIALEATMQIAAHYQMQLYESASN